MSTPRQALEGLRKELERRSSLIKRSASLLKVTFHPSQELFFTLQVWWRGGELLKRIHFEDVFQYTGTAEPRLAQTPCRLARQLIQEILTARGI